MHLQTLLFVLIGISLAQSLPEFSLRGTDTHFFKRLLSSRYQVPPPQETGGQAPPSTDHAPPSTDVVSFTMPGEAASENNRSYGPHPILVEIYRYQEAGVYAGSIVVSLYEGYHAWMTEHMVVWISLSIGQHHFQEHGLSLQTPLFSMRFRPNHVTGNIPPQVIVKVEEVEESEQHPPSPTDIVRLRMPRHETSAFGRSNGLHPLLVEAYRYREPDDEHAGFVTVELDVHNAVGITENSRVWIRVSIGQHSFQEHDLTSAQPAFTMEFTAEHVAGDTPPRVTVKVERVEE